MKDLPRTMRVLTRVTLYYVALCFLVVAFIPTYRAIALGLILGSSVSYINTYYLAYKVRKVSELAAGESNKRVNLGFLTRAALAVLAVMYAYKSNGAVNFYAVAGSLIYAQFLLLVIGIYFSKREK